MDGLTAVSHIRQQEVDAGAGTEGQGGTRQLVIALTGNARQGQITQAVEAGMDHGELVLRFRSGWWAMVC